MALALPARRAYTVKTTIYSHKMYLKEIPECYDSFISNSPLISISPLESSTCYKS